MKRYLIYVACLLSMLPILSKAQTATEAYRLSTSDPTGTARNLGVGNSMFAIGPDFSAIGSNPAGLGGYGKSEFLITSSFGTSIYSSAFPADRFTTSTGNYTIPSVPAGGYDLTIEHPGFRKFVQNGLRVQVANTARVDVTLEVGSTTDSVTITADAPLLKSE
ncbi:MAG: carboxypeptidase-like regulatory domain-containing protein, partial [Saprospiraceae bacterium]